MGLFDRAKIVFRSKADSALTRAEDPRQQLDYAYERQRQLLQKVRRGVAEVTASRARVEMQAQALRLEQDKLTSAAARALEVGREDLAREALQRKSNLEAQLAELANQHALLSSEEEKLVRASAQLQEKIEAFRIRKESLKAQYAAAEAQVRVREAYSGIGDEMGDIGRVVQNAEDRTAQMQARAQAVDELIAAGTLEDSGEDAVMKELDELARSSRVEAEMTALKRQLHSKRAAGQLQAGETPNHDDLR